MTSIKKRRATQALIVCTTAAILLTGCGGGGGGNDSNAKVLPCNGVTALLTLGLACVVPIVDNRTPPPEPPPPPPSDPANSPLILMGAYDVEPNNEIAMANPVTFPAPLSPTQRVGFHVNGTHSNVSDGMDAFAMVANRARTLEFLLCASSAGEECNQVFPDARLDINTAYLNVYDQGGMLLLTSQANTIDGNLLQMQVDAGVLYYVMVVAQNTGNSVQDYYLRVYESASDT